MRMLDRKYSDTNSTEHSIRKGENVPHNNNNNNGNSRISGKKEREREKCVGMRT